MCLRRDGRLHLRTCRFCPLMVCVKRIINAYNVHSTLFVTCMKCINSWSIVSSHTLNFSAWYPAVSETRKRDSHVRTCRCAPPFACVKRKGLFPRLHPEEVEAWPFEVRWRDVQERPVELWGSISYLPSFVYAFFAGDAREGSLIRTCRILIIFK